MAVHTTMSREVTPLTRKSLDLAFARIYSTFLHNTRTTSILHQNSVQNRHRARDMQECFINQCESSNLERSVRECRFSHSIGCAIPVISPERHHHNTRLMTETIADFHKPLKSFHRKRESGHKRPRVQKRKDGQNSQVLSPRSILWSCKLCS